MVVWYPRDVVPIIRIQHGGSHRPETSQNLGVCGLYENLSISAVLRNFASRLNLIKIL